MSYDPYELEVAMCLWGAELARGKDFPEGAGDRRLKVANLTYLCESTWLHAKAHGYDDCFDWEFCPWFVDQCGPDFMVPTDIKERAACLAKA